MKNSKLITLILAIAFTFTSINAFSMPTIKKPPQSVNQIIPAN
ncbi:MAG: hypothetical protein ACI8Y3_000020 [Paraglaciecola sp.]|jgi:hypothetical protein